MGASSRTLGAVPRQPPATPAAQSLVQTDPALMANGGMDPAGTPSSGYDALAESRKRLAAAAAGRRSLFTTAGATLPVLGAG